MLRYHDFGTAKAAYDFLEELLAKGGIGYVLTYNSGWHQVREIV